MLNLAVFASGNGSNLQAIIDACDRGQLSARVSAVISNNSNSFALNRARIAGIDAYHISQKKHPDYVDYIRRLIEVLDKHAIELIVLAGYMRMIPVELIDRFKSRIINIHPALLPKYGGAGMYGGYVHQAIIAAKEIYSGATVHVVDSIFDHGPILIQRRVPVYPDDTPETLAARVLEVEHIILPEAISLFIK